MQSLYNPITMKIHREGYKILLGAFSLLLAINLLLYFFADYAVTRIVIPSASALFFLFILNFFRFPNRECPRTENQVFSPADGKVVAIEKVFEKEYFKEERLMISIFMSAWNVHINWAPVEGEVSYSKYNPGAFMVAFLPKSSTHNEHTTTVIKDSEQREVLVRQIAGAVARRIVTYPKSGERIAQGHELGFIKFGSRVDLYLPVDSRVTARIGDKVSGSITSIAELTANEGV